MWRLVNHVMMKKFNCLQQILTGQDHGVCECDGPNCTCECRCLNGWRKDESNPGACECQPIRLSSCIDPAVSIQYMFF